MDKPESVGTLSLVFTHPTVDKPIMMTIPRGVMYDKRYFDVSVNGTIVYITQREIRGE